MKLTDTNVIPTAILADKYKKLLGFETVSEKLLKNCSAFINAPLTSMKKMRKFLAEVESEFSGEDLKLILRLISSEDGRSRSRSLSRSRSRSRSPLSSIKSSPRYSPSYSPSSSIGSGYMFG